MNSTLYALVVTLFGDSDVTLAFTYEQALDILRERAKDWSEFQIENAAPHLMGVEQLEAIYNHDGAIDASICIVETNMPKEDTHE